MNKYISFLICFLFATFIAQSQVIPKGLNVNQARTLAEDSSDYVLLNYVRQAKNQGLSLNEVKRLLKAQGASLTDLKKLEELWNDDFGKNDLYNYDSNEQFTSNFGINPSLSNNPLYNDQIINENIRDRFGSEFFESSIKMDDTPPELYIATPNNYQLGPGEEIIINIYGASEESYELQISREGFIKVDGLAPIFLSGLSIENAKETLIYHFSSIYSGLKADKNDPSKVNIQLSLGKSRSVVVNIIGQVRKPGTYTLSSFTSLINALYAAGGPNDQGTYRAIRIIRNGEFFKEIDLYDFFVNGSFEIFYLQDQDVIQVPTYESEVKLEGAFKYIGYFELKEGETIADLFKFSGGISSNGFHGGVYLNRLSDYRRIGKTIKLPAEIDFKLADGDVIFAHEVQELVEEEVSIEGSVYLPGKYSISSPLSIKELIELAGGLLRSALIGNATLYRLQKGVENKVVTIDLNEIESNNLILRDGDRLVISDESEVFDSGNITIKGEVNSPGTLPFRDGLSISDVLIQAQGFTSIANRDQVTVYQNELREGETFTRVDVVSFDDKMISNRNIALSPNSLVIVRKDPNFREVEEVYLSGLVLNEGNYALKGNTYRLYDLINDSGGFLKNAYLKGISITRPIFSDKDDSKESEILDESIKEALKEDLPYLDEMNTREKVDNITKLKNQTNDTIRDVFDRRESIIIGVDGEKLMTSLGKDLNENIVLQKGDSINVPKLDNTINVLGAVQKKSKMVFNGNLNISRAIRYAGGTIQNAKSSSVYIIYKNGTIKSRTRIFGFINIDPRIEPGSTIIVPEKLKNQGRASLGEILGITSSLTTLVLLLQQIGI
jgi:protein involved in polysaccharide export with SLBB domain